MKMNLVRIQFAAIVMLAGASLLALDSSSEANGKPRDDEPADIVLARVPKKARLKRNPVENDPEAAMAGKKLFEQHCAECHGKIADGTKRGPSLRASRLRNAMPGEIFWIVTNGVVRRGMPAWSKLPEPQRWQIVTFLRELSGPPDSTGSNDAAPEAKNGIISPELSKSAAIEFGCSRVSGPSGRRCR
jgi:mono/diheme cytochrome c family protein